MSYAKNRIKIAIIDVKTFEIIYNSKLEKTIYTYIVMKHPRCNAKLVIESLCGVPNPFNLVKGITISNGMKKGKAFSSTRFQIMIFITGTKSFSDD